MVNSKKMSKSSIAVIVLSILLVLSMILGLTGAWFTSSTGGADNNQVDFGTIALGAVENEDFSTARAIESSDTETVKAMPGDTITYKLDVSNAGTNDLYYIVKIDFDGTGAAGAGFTSAYYALSGKVENKDDLGRINHGAAAQTVTVETTIPNTTADNALQGKTVTVKATVYAVQTANMTAEQAYNALVALATA